MCFQTFSNWLWITRGNTTLLANCWDIIFTIGLIGLQTESLDFIKYPYPQDGVINRHQPDKINTFYAFDTECILEVDKFLIYIDNFTNQTECLNSIQQDFLPISILIPKYIQNIPNHKVLTALFGSVGAITLIHKHMLLKEVTPWNSTKQIFFYSGWWVPVK